VLPVLAKDFSCADCTVSVGSKYMTTLERIRTCEGVKCSRILLSKLMQVSLSEPGGRGV
jgi:hypothetical protein